jgi:hypothetical protein
VPGAPGQGVPVGGTAGQFLQKTTTGVDYATDWVTVNLTGLATESWVTAGFYPLTGNPSGFLTAASLSGYATESWVTSQGYITSSALTPYLTKADNLGSLTNFATARSNLSLGTLDTPVFAGVTAQGSGLNVSNLTPTSLSMNHTGFGSFVIQPSSGITFPDSSVQTTAFTTAQLTNYLAKASNLSDLPSVSTARTNLGLGSLAVVNDAPSDGSQYARKNGAWDVVSVPASYITSVSSPLSVTSGNLTIDLSAYAPLASPVFTGDARAVTPAFGDNDTSIATTAFVQAGLLGGTAVARNLEVEVRNQSGSTIPAGRIVYISGATGNKPLITLAQANNDANSAQTIGFVKTSIANNGTGYVIVRGELENIDTSALTEGVQLYLSPTTAGTWTTTKPSAPQHLVYVGIVIRSHPTQGTILVAVQNGYELGEIHDVALSGLANNDLLAYESSTDLWKNKTYSALGLLTSADAATTYAPKASPTFTGLATFDNPGNYAISVPGSGVGYDTRLESNVFSMRNAGIEVIRIGAGGIKYPDGVTQSVAYPGPSGFLLKADNLSGLASTSTARTNLGLGTMAVETATNYLTTASASSTYFTIANAANKADLNSPTFTGTPTLPTGTIGVTQTAGNNTTALATTAFVTAAVPAFASTAQVVTGTSTTTALAPGNAGFLKADPRLRSLAHISFTRVSGSGVVSSGNVGIGIREMFLGSLATGLAGYSYGWTGLVAVNMSGADLSKVDFSKKIWMAGSAMCGGTLGGTNYIGDANTRNRVTLGGYNSDTVSGDMTVKGIGWKKVGGTSPFFTLTVHNGTTLTDVATTVTQSSLKVINWVIYSDGTGNVTLYIDGVQAATTSAGPTGTSNANQATYREQVEAVATPTVRAIMECSGGWLYLAD